MQNDIFRKYLKFMSATVIVLLMWLPLSTAHAKIRIGTVKFDPPYVFSLDQGFEIELIKIICHRLHENCELVTMRYFELFDALQKEEIDLGIDSIPFHIDTADSPYIYSFPYLLSKGQFLGLKNSHINSVMDIPPGASVGLVRENWRADNGAFNKYFKFPGYAVYSTSAHILQLTPHVVIYSL